MGLVFATCALNCPFPWNSLPFSLTYSESPKAPMATLSSNLVWLFLSKCSLSLCLSTAVFLHVPFRLFPLLGHICFCPDFLFLFHCRPAFVASALVYVTVPGEELNKHSWIKINTFILMLSEEAGQRVGLVSLSLMYWHKTLWFSRGLKCCESGLLFSSVVFPLKPW